MPRAFSANIVIMIRILLKFGPNPPAHTENNLTTREPYWYQSSQDHLPHDCALAARFDDEGIFGLSTGNKFHLDITAGFRLLRARREEGSKRGETSRTSNRTTAPAPELDPRSLRAAVRSERHRWLRDRRLLKGGVLAFTGGNDDRSRSKYGRVLIGWFLVFSQSWKTVVETRNALAAPGRPGCRPTPKLSI